MIPNSFGVYTAAGNPEFDLLVGVTSMGSKNCSDGSPSIYTSIGAFWDWILKEIGKEDVNSSPNLLFCPDRFVQVPDPSEEPSPTVMPFSEADEVADDELKEELEQQELEEWRKEIRGLSQEQLIKVALIMKIVANRQTAL